MKFALVLVLAFLGMAVTSPVPSAADGTLEVNNLFFK
jgi:hypothetical protein